MPISAGKLRGLASEYTVDRLVLSHDDIDLSRSPLTGKLGLGTYALGVFNPGLTVLPSGNLLMMVRVAEALREPISDGKVRSIRWADENYYVDEWPLQQADSSDPRKFLLRGSRWRTMALTSLSWLLPVELTQDGLEVVASTMIAQSRRARTIRRVVSKTLASAALTAATS